MSVSLSLSLSLSLSVSWLDSFIVGKSRVQMAIREHFTRPFSKFEMTGPVIGQ